MGDSVTEAEPPNWKDVAQRAESLLGSTKDVRVVIHLTKALLNTEGYAGFRDALAVLRGFVEKYWEGLHPELDPDDDNDPTERVNAVMELCDPQGTLTWLRNAPLVDVRGLGSFGLRDLAVVSGELEHTGEGSAPTGSQIDAAFSNVELEELQATTEVVNAALEHAKAIEDGITERVATGMGPEMSALTGQLSKAIRTLSERVARRGGGEAPVDDATAEAGGEAAPGNGAPAAPAMVPGEIRSRDQVAKAIDKICEYYERFEPSSPIPLLLRRCQRLVDKDFMEIVRDIAPDGIDQVENVRGPLPEEEE